MSDDDKTPLDSALDLFVYAPVGLFITVTEELPNLVQKGRQRLGSQLTMARMMGQMAAPQLQKEAEKAVKGVVDRIMPPGRPQEPAPPPGAATGVPAAPAATPTREAPAPPPDTGVPAPDAGAPIPAAAPAPGPTAAAPAAPSSPGSAPGGSAAGTAHLAIPGYDSLSAMQVVQRLAGLDPPELAAVRAYEVAHRGRKTILSRADQLLAESAG